MKRKTWMFALIIIIVVIACYSPIVASYTLGETTDIIYAENVHVLVIGRCRTIGSDGTWHGGLFLGNQTHSAVETGNATLERLRVIVYNNSISIPWMTFSRLTRAFVEMNNASGVFFWSSKGSGVSILPPIIFVKCHTEKLWISIFD